MPSKKRKYNARFPAGRIKRIMQADEEVGKIANHVPVIISRTLELFVESLLSKSSSITVSRNAKTLSPSHLKQCIMSESRFDFLKDLVKSVPDIGQDDQQQNDGLPSTSYNGELNGQNHRSTLQRSQSLQSVQNSAPSTSTSGSSQCQYHQLNQQKFHLNNYTNQHRPNNQVKISRNHSYPASATITSEQSQKSTPTLNFPIQISYNIDGASTSQLESPAVKIDYSNFTLPATSPSIKIDLSSFNQHTSKPSTSSTTTVTNTQTAPTNLDEDYDV